MEPDPDRFGFQLGDLFCDERHGPLIDHAQADDEGEYGGEWLVV